MPIPLSEDVIRNHNADLIVHLPLGFMRDEWVRQGADSPDEVFMALVSYYAAPEEERRQIRRVFYAMEKGEHAHPQSPTPTSGELAEDMGQVVVPELPAELVQLCRMKLFPLVSEHGEVDESPGAFEKVLRQEGVLPPSGGIEKCPACVEKGDLCDEHLAEMAKGSEEFMQQLEAEGIRVPTLSEVDPVEIIDAEFDDEPVPDLSSDEPPYVVGDAVTVKRSDTGENRGARVILCLRVGEHEWSIVAHDVMEEIAYRFTLVG